MTLNEFKSCIDQAVEYAGDTADHVDVEMHIRGKVYGVGEISQFGIVPTLVVIAGDLMFDFSDEEPTND